MSKRFRQGPFDQGNTFEGADELWVTLRDGKLRSLPPRDAYDEEARLFLHYACDVMEQLAWEAQSAAGVAL